MDFKDKGIEDKEALQNFKTLGCDVAQGYYIGRRVPTAQIDA